ncbi:MAG: hypothetical protein JNK38_01155 [Acidobacteria bacterium]|nr:hypothetical protein [Acidobacteriota bacterium]
MKVQRAIVLCVLLLMPLLAMAQPSLCTISGTLYDSTGSACSNCKVTISKARQGSTPLNAPPIEKRTDSNGAVSFTAVQGSFITITGTFSIGRYNFATGLEMYVPLQSTATLATLQTAEDALNALISSTTYAPADIPVITKTASASLSNEFALGSLATGLLKNTTTTGVPTIAVAGTDYVAPGAITGGGQTMATARILGRSTASTGAIEEISIGSGLSLSGGTLSASGGGAVSSVFGRSGAVVAAQDDYTFAQLASKPTTLAGYGIADAQPLDADLTAIAALGPSNDDIIQRKAGVWTNRTVAQFKTDLGLATIATSGSASDLSAGTVPLARLAGITNTEISNSAAIAYSKLNLTGAILNADLAGSIANAKLANSAITIAGSSTSLGGAITLDTITGLSTTGVVKRTGANTLAIATVDLTSEVTGDLPFANFVQAGSAGFVGATGAGDYSHRTPTQVTAALDAFVGDSGSGGTKGLVPAPTAGDAAANKYLKADGTWATVSGSSGITVGTTTITSGTSGRVGYNNAGVYGEYPVTGTAGNVVLSASPTLTGTVAMAAQTNSGTIVQTSASATAFVSGASGSTNPAFVIDNSTASQASGLKVIGKADGTAPEIAAISRTQITTALAGNGLAITADPAIAGSSVAGAAAGGSVTITAGAAARNTSGNAAGGSINLAPGTGIGTGAAGDVILTRGNLIFGAATSGNIYLRNTGSGPSLFIGSADGAANNAGVWVQQVSFTQLTSDSGVVVGIQAAGSTGMFLGSGVPVYWSTNASSSTTGLRDAPSVGFLPKAAGVLRLTNGSTGAGSLVLGTSTVGSIGTSGVGVLAIANGTAPTSSPADEFQLYSADSAAGDANAFARNEAGEVNRLTGLSARVSTQFDKTSDTTLANVTGLSRNVEAGRTYAFTAVLYTTSNVAGGVKAAIGGTATATSIIYQADVLDGSTQATVGTARATALATTVGDVTAVTAARITITGAIVVNAAGTLTVQFAQNASNGSASSVLVNSSFQLIPIS